MTSPVRHALSYPFGTSVPCLELPYGTLWRPILARLLLQAQSRTLPDCVYRVQAYFTALPVEHISRCKSLKNLHQGVQTVSLTT
jgi:hypothetical protein